MFLRVATQPSPDLELNLPLESCKGTTFYPHPIRTPVTVASVSFPHPHANFRLPILASYLLQTMMIFSLEKSLVSSVLFLLPIQYCIVTNQN